MIDAETKTKLLEEIEKDGNVYRACAKLGVGTTTFYRWKTDKLFWKKAQEAIKVGRQNACYIGEHALLSLVKDKDLPAIKYLLSHNSSIYKPREVSKVILEHHRKLNKSDLPPPVTIEDFFDKWQEEDTVQTELPNHAAGPVPNAPGTPITLPQEEVDTESNQAQQHSQLRSLHPAEDES